MSASIPSPADGGLSANTAPQRVTAANSVLVTQQERDHVFTLLAQAVRSIFSRWFAFSVAATEHGPSSAAVAAELLDDTLLIIQSTATSPTVDDYIDLFDHAFDRMNTQVEDGSIEQVAALLVRIRDSALRGDLAILHHQLRQRHPAIMPHQVNIDSSGRSSSRVPTGSDDDDDDDDPVNDHDRADMDRSWPHPEDDNVMHIDTPLDTPSHPYTYPQQEHPIVVDEDGFELVVRKKKHPHRPSPSN